MTVFQRGEKKIAIESNCEARGLDSPNRLTYFTRTKIKQYFSSTTYLRLRGCNRRSLQGRINDITGVSVTPFYIYIDFREILLEHVELNLNVETYNDNHKSVGED